MGHFPITILYEDLCSLTTAKRRGKSLENTKDTFYQYWENNAPMIGGDIIQYAGNTLTS